MDVGGNPGSEEHLHPSLDLNGRFQTPEHDLESENNDIGDLFPTKERLASLLVEEYSEADIGDFLKALDIATPELETAGENVPCTSSSLTNSNNNTPNGDPTASSKIINVLTDVNDLSKCENKSYSPKDLTLHNINETIPMSPVHEDYSDLLGSNFSDQDSPRMKPDRSSLDEWRRKAKSTLMESLAKVLMTEEETGEDGGVARAKVSLLDRLRKLHNADQTNILPSPEVSESDGERFQGSLSGTILSVIEEVSSRLDSSDSDPRSKGSADGHSESDTPEKSRISLILSKIESEVDNTMPVTTIPCTKCTVCVKMVYPIHDLAKQIRNMDNKIKSASFVELWRDIKEVIKRAASMSDISDSCSPCELCFDICTNYHAYIESKNYRKRAKIRENYANIVKSLDPLIQVVLNSSVCSSITTTSMKKDIALVPRKGIDVLKKTIDDHKNKQAYFNAVSKNISSTSIVSYPVEVKINPAFEESSCQPYLQVTSEFETPTGSSFTSSDDLDTSAGVNTIPIYESASRKEPANDESSILNTISDNMKNELVDRINVAICKEVLFLRKDLTDRILRSISPSISSSDMRSIENALKNAPTHHTSNPNSILSKSKDRSDNKASNSNHQRDVKQKNVTIKTANFAASLYATPVLPVIRKQKVNKYDLMKQLPIAEEYKEDRKQCILSNMNRPPSKLGNNQLYINKYHSGKRKCPQKKDTRLCPAPLEFHSKDFFTTKITSSTDFETPDLDYKKKVHVQHIHKRKKNPRQRDDTLSNVTFSTYDGSETSSFKNNFVNALDSINLNLQSRESSASSDTMQDLGADQASTSCSEDSKSYCCVCVQWEDDIEMLSPGSSDTKPELSAKPMESAPGEDLGSITETFVSDVNSDDSGGRTDFTAYTAVVQKKPNQKSSRLSIPKKLKLDLPRSLTKNSPSSFLISKSYSKSSKERSGSLIPTSYTSNNSNSKSRLSNNRDESTNKVDKPNVLTKTSSNLPKYSPTKEKISNEKVTNNLPVTVPPKTALVNHNKAKDEAELYPPKNPPIPSLQEGIIPVSQTLKIEVGKKANTSVTSNSSKQPTSLANYKDTNTRKTLDDHRKKQIEAASIPTHKKSTSSQPKGCIKKRIKDSGAQIKSVLRPNLVASSGIPTATKPNTPITKDSKKSLETIPKLTVQLHPTPKEQCSEHVHIKSTDLKKPRHTAENRRDDCSKSQLKKRSLPNAASPPLPTKHKSSPNTSFKCNNSLPSSVSIKRTTVIRQGLQVRPTSSPAPKYPSTRAATSDPKLPEQQGVRSAVSSRSSRSLANSKQSIFSYCTADSGAVSLSRTMSFNNNGSPFRLSKGVFSTSYSNLNSRSLYSRTVGPELKSRGVSISFPKSKQYNKR